MELQAKKSIIGKSVHEENGPSNQSFWTSQRRGGKKMSTEGKKGGEKA